ncbi:hypothetical protein CEXT_526731 [Caerostris extrusa]|uniref:Uncharacterized protein n=1 Tax=Caerostris extrusa TaxID=172846 RepID=A0AAV4MUX9_CAEEX|nr:hypothetical protein CEXT_526731 [Caerostris extrusa]
MHMTISAVLRYVTDSAGIYRVGNSIGISRMQDAAQFGALISRKKWKVSGDCRNVPRVGRPMKLGDRDRRMLIREILKNPTQPMALIREEFQQRNGPPSVPSGIRRHFRPEIYEKASVSSAFYTARDSSPESPNDNCTRMQMKLHDSSGMAHRLFLVGLGAISARKSTQRLQFQVRFIQPGIP